MNHQIRNGLFGITLAGVLASALASTSVLAQERFVTIGTGGQTGVYYTAGQSVCRFLNRAEVKPAIKCNAPSTAGSVTNIVSLHKGEYDFGFIQSDHQHKALQGLAPFDKEGAVELRAVFSLQSEILTVVVRNDSGITDLAGLEGKRVNIGVPGSGSRDTFEEVMQAKGWTNASFALAAELKPAEMASALGDNNLDAITYVVGHPSGAIQEALTNVKARIIPVQGAEIDSLLAKADYYRCRGNPRRALPGCGRRHSVDWRQGRAGDHQQDRPGGRLSAGQVGVRQPRQVQAPASGLCRPQSRRHDSRRTDCATARGRRALLQGERLAVGQRDQRASPPAEYRLRVPRTG